MNLVLLGAPAGKETQADKIAQDFYTFLPVILLEITFFWFGLEITLLTKQKMG